jgi:hypothetical protein
MTKQQAERRDRARLVALLKQMFVEVVEETHRLSLADYGSNVRFIIKDRTDTWRVKMKSEKYVIEATVGLMPSGATNYRSVMRIVSFADIACDGSCDFQACNYDWHESTVEVLLPV